MSERSRRKAATLAATGRTGSAASPAAAGETALAKAAGDGWRVWVAAALLTIAILAAYHGCYRVPFLFDDHLALEDNRSIMDGRLAEAFSPPNTATTAGRPVLNLSFALNFLNGGLSVGGYHAVNLLIHVLASLTLLGLVRRTLLTPRLAPRFAGAALPVAATAALVWALHPVLTESVTYISQRAESLMGLFYLLTLACFIRSAAPAPGKASAPGKAPPSPGATGWAILSVIACLLGTGTKEVIVTAPIVVLLYDRVFLSRSLGEALGRRPWYYPSLAACWVVLGILMAGSQMGSARGIGFGQGLDPGSYLLIEGRVILGYLRLAFWPHPLIFDYGREYFLPAGPHLLPYGAAVLALIGASLWLWGRKSAPAGFVCFCFFIILAPTSSIVPISLQPMAESRMYLPLVPVVVAVVAAGYAYGGASALAAFAAVALGLGVLTAERNRVYASNVGLWRDALAQVPLNSRGHYNLGQSLGKLPGRVPDAIAEYKEAIRIRPDFAEPYNNLGAALVALPGHVPEAIQDYRKAIELKPDYADAISNLGATLAEAGNLTAAVEEFKKSVQLDPYSPGAQNNLGTALTNLGGHSDEAIDHLETALRLNPDMPEAERNLGRALIQAGRRDEAIDHLENAVRLRPDFEAAILDLGDACLAKGRRQEAEKWYAQAVSLKAGDADLASKVGQALSKAGDAEGAVAFLKKAAGAAPNSSEALNSLGVTLAQSGHIAEAETQFAEAVRADPEDPVAHANLGNALLATGHPGQAVTEFETALRLRPGYDAIRANLAYARKRLAANGPGTASGTAQPAPSQ